MRPALLGALFLAIAVAGCASSAPTPQIIYVTPPPTPTAAASDVAPPAPGPSSPSGPGGPAVASTSTPSAAEGSAVANSAAPSAAPSSVPSAPGAPSAPVEPSAATGAQSTCSPQAPTALSAGWATQQSQLADFSFETPANWAVREDYGAKPISGFIDPDDITAAGLDPASVVTPDSVGAPGGVPGVPNVRIFTILDVTVPADVVRSISPRGTARSPTTSSGGPTSRSVSGARSVRLRVHELVPSLEVAYVWHSTSHLIEVGQGLERIGFELRQQIIWVKTVPVLSRSPYN